MVYCKIREVDGTDSVSWVLSRGNALGRVPVRVTAVVHGAGCAEGPSEDPALQRIYTKNIPNFEI